MSTLRRDLRQKFEKILNDYIASGQTYLGESVPSEVLDKLADAALEAIRKPSFDMSKAGLDWAVLSGEVTQEAIDQNKLAEEAKGAFERDLHFNPLPWSSTKDWEKLESFVIDQFKKDNQVFFKYDSWRKGKGKFAGALNNKNITQTPSCFSRDNFINKEPRINNSRLDDVVIVDSS